MRTYQYILMPSGDMSTPLASTGQKIEYTWVGCVQAVYASTGNGTPNGLISLNGSVDGIHWVTINGSTTSITSSGVGIWNFFSAIGYDYLQGVFTPNAGSSGQLQLTLFSKGS